MTAMDKIDQAAYKRLAAELARRCRIREVS